MRVYRYPLNLLIHPHSSLTIREGISTLYLFAEPDRAFPHYTWGYIGQLDFYLNINQVPSLYVRVYRHQRRGSLIRFRSLTIREGISRARGLKKFFPFPHYTWGYIDTVPLRRYLTGVPSLYVRVYRVAVSYFFNNSGSLTIREGISPDKVAKNRNAVFPHYTWGYIVYQHMNVSYYAVPSLYVRVYRSFRGLEFLMWRSLTIREGISPLACLALY